jgi:hypothetical protein
MGAVAGTCGAARAAALAVKRQEDDSADASKLTTVAPNRVSTRTR